MKTENFEWINMRKSYQKRVVLDIPHIKLEKGKRYAVVGENGAGKSTFIKMLAGIVKSDCKGDISNEKYHISYMPQTPYIFDMSVLDNMRKTIKVKNITELEHILEKMDINNLKDKQATLLSGGEKQRLAFCRVISQPCELLLLDEPSAAMDVYGAKMFEQLIQDYQKKNCCTVVMVLHDIVQVKRLAEEIIFMKEGKVIMQGEYKELFFKTENPFVREYANYFFD